jgi:hypothetical protein
MNENVRKENDDDRQRRDELAKRDDHARGNDQQAARTSNDRPGLTNREREQRWPIG